MFFVWEGSAIGTRTGVRYPSVTSLPCCVCVCTSHSVSVESWDGPEGLCRKTTRGLLITSPAWHWVVNMHWPTASDGTETSECHAPCSEAIEVNIREFMISSPLAFFSLSPEDSNRLFTHTSYYFDKRSPSLVPPQTAMHGWGLGVLDCSLCLCAQKGPSPVYDMIDSRPVKRKAHHSPARVSPWLPHNLCYEWSTDWKYTNDY